MILYNPTVSGSLVVTGSLTTTGTITSQTLVVQTITSSVSYLTGSTQHGSVIGNTHQFTGSVSVSGSVGIGTNSPSQLLEVVGGEIKAGRVDSTNEGGQVSFGRATDNATGWYIDVYGNTSTPSLRFVDVSNSAVRLTINSSGQVVFGSTLSNGTYTYTLPGATGTLALTSNLSSYMPLSGGTFTDGVTINATSGTTASRFRIIGTGVSTFLCGQNSRGGVIRGQGGFDELSFWTGGTGEEAAGGGGTERMRISGNGSIGAGGSTTNIYNASDIRLKKNITPITLGLSTISALNPVRFNWADGFDLVETDKTLLGFIAQEIQEVLPEAVESFSGETKVNDTIITDALRVNEKFIIPVLVKAIQEQQAKITALEEILQRNNIQ